MSGLNSLHVKTEYVEPFFAVLNLFLFEIPTDLQSCGEYAFVKACLIGLNINTCTSYKTAPHFSSNVCQRPLELLNNKSAWGYQ